MWILLQRHTRGAGRSLVHDTHDAERSFLASRASCGSRGAERSFLARRAWCGSRAGRSFLARRARGFR
jgi:hypothetical protein